MSEGSLSKVWNNIRLELSDFCHQGQDTELAQNI
jgi:hypothetical protein